VIAGGFLYLTFRGVDAEILWRSMAGVGLGSTLLLVFISTAILGARALRWWLTLPSPRTRPELRWATKALVLGYAMNNLAPRAGEVLRLFMMERKTGRGLGVVASSLVIERVFFDFSVFALLLVFAGYAFRDLLIEIQPAAAPLLLPFAVMVAISIGVLFLLSLAPRRVEKLVAFFRLDKAPYIGPWLERTAAQFNEGLSVLSEPGPLMRASAVNLIAWALSFAYFWVGVAAFGVDISASRALFLFALATIAILLPSPGGLGAVHYALTLGLVYAAGVEKSFAAAIATYVHFVNYATQMVLGALALWWSPMEIERVPAAASNSPSEERSTGDA
jgi:hypothetical protein